MRMNYKDEQFSLQIPNSLGLCVDFLLKIENIESLDLKCQWSTPKKNEIILIETYDRNRNRQKRNRLF
jgi:hypothetical protein